ncbi:MAG TPA: DNA/RNA non-specific endonuclease [Pyrinomonadaceae bacterium]|nr:DNA/RNA non-specific endonuclease [Pyrinomonadaceae bacterium]
MIKSTTKTISRRLPTHMAGLVVLLVLFASFFFLTGQPVQSAGNPSVVVNKYFNSGSTADVVELLVIQDALDMRGMIIKDFSGNMVNDGGGKFTFTTNALWSSVRAGTLITLRNDNSAADITVGGADYNLDLGMTNATYFTSGGGAFDIATTDMLMIKAAGSGTAGVTGSIHVLAGGTAGAQFTATAVPKLIASGTSGTNQFVFANSATQSINDFDGTGATGAATGLTFGAGNNANNTAYINSLRSGPPPTPMLSINDVSHAEGNTGTTAYTFTVSLSAPAPVGGVTFDVDTADDTATTADNDYILVHTTGVTIAAGLTSANVIVQVVGDTNIEPTETFFVNVSNVVGAPVTDAQGLGTITNDDNVGSTGIVISQVYGGGGNSGATLTNDFIELFNRGNAPVSLNGWAVQYGSATGSSFTVTPLTNFTLQPGQYYLIQEAAGSGGTTALPTPDATGTIAMALGAGKIALTSDAVALSGSGCPFGPSVVDFVGYGTTANCSETAPTATLTNTTAAVRGNAGCTETDNNSADFATGDPTPHNSDDDLHVCGGPSGPTGVGAANPNPVAAGAATLLTVTVTPGTLPTSTGLAVTGNLSLIGGSSTQMFFDNATNGDVTAGDNIFSYQATVDLGTGGGIKSLPMSITDAEARAGSTHISLTVQAHDPSVSGAANPSTVAQGASVVLTATVIPGVSPDSTGLAVTGDLTAIGGSATQTFFDDGVTGGDTVAGNSVFTFTATVPGATTTGAKNLPLSVTDAQVRSGSGSISLTVTTPPAAHDPSEHLVMGNPNGATADVAFPDNYLMMKVQYALSFNNSREIPNWTSWHLDSTWRAGAPRQDDFRNDTTLPPGFHQVLGTDYSGSGFDRGHMCPSADRTSSIPDNSATFLMTNMVPQAPGNNQGPWASLENYLRTFLPNNELYIVSGGVGVGGTGSGGGTTNVLASGVTVPQKTWKVVLILPVGDNDVARVDNSTRTIAVIMPNIDSIRPDQWQKYLATIDQVETLTGYDLFSNVDPAAQTAIEAKVDAGNDTAPVTANQTRVTKANESVSVTLAATDFNVNNVFTFTIVSPPTHGSLSGSGANLSYTPTNTIYTGPDAFTYKANDGGLDSNTSTVNINILSPTAADGLVNGRITEPDGTPIAGAVVDLGGTQIRRTITDANGNYRFAGVQTQGLYTVTPSRTNYSFSPSQRSFSQQGNVTEAAFTGSPVSNAVNPLSSPEFFVRQHYLDFLGREPDESGFTFWSDQVRSCGSDVGCIERRTINVSAAYFLSIEFQQTGGLVDGLYRASYGRAPRFSEFMPDTRTVGQDVVVGTGDWEGALRANKQAFVEAFVQRAAFRAVYDQLSNDRFVADLIGHTGVSFTQTEREALVSGLDNGLLSRATVLARLAEDPRFVSAKRNEAFVTMEYFGYLRRDPDASGYQFWLNKLNQFNGNFEQAEMVKAFINSGEYRDRFPR